MAERDQPAQQPVELRGGFHLCSILTVLLVAPLCLVSSPASRAAVSSDDDDHHRTTSHLLGRGHLWLEIERVDFTGATEDVWGVDTDLYVGLAGWWGGPSNVYLGVELGRIGIGTTRTEDGEIIEDFAFDSGEFNFKKLFHLVRGLSFGVGGGAGVFLARGKEVLAYGRADLADFGFGYQGFIEFNWRVRRFVIGLDAKYQAAVDFLSIDYSNLRLGAHVGVVF